MFDCCMTMFKIVVLYTYYYKHRMTGNWEKQWQQSQTYFPVAVI